MFPTAGLEVEGALPVLREGEDALPVLREGEEALPVLRARSSGTGFSAARPCC